MYTSYIKYQSVLIKLYLETGVDVVPKLAAEVHARPHRWTLRLNIPEGGRGQDAGGGNVSSDIFLC